MKALSEDDGLNFHNLRQQARVLFLFSTMDMVTIALNYCHIKYFIPDCGLLAQFSDNFCRSSHRLSHFSALFPLPQTFSYTTHRDTFCHFHPKKHDYSFCCVRDSAISSKPFGNLRDCGTNYFLNFYCACLI